MNITELARILRIHPQELRNLLPQLGFNIGQKAIKIDNNTARKIVREWPGLYRNWLQQKAAEEALRRSEQLQNKENRRSITIPNFIAVRDFSSLSQIPVNKILAELMRNGIFVSINQKIDFDTAVIVGADLGLDVVLEENKETISEEKEENKLKKIIEQENQDTLQIRPPIIVIMGHVDHGKTKLLDSIRNTDVVAGEAGGITQHIGAYQIERHGRKISFIDTPGHEAFTAMRSRGAKVADIAILVVAADDGVKPQTVEAFRIIEAAKLPFIVAINKIDKSDADVDRTKQELSAKLNIIPEDWGGKATCVPISAHTGQGIDTLLEMVLLKSDTEAESLKANPKSEALGTVIESRIDKGAGPVATILVQNGTLKIGDQLCFNGIFYGKVRALKNYKGEDVNKAEPSCPVKIIGLKVCPEIGDILEVGEGEKIKLRKKEVSQHIEVKSMVENEENAIKINLIVKSDFLGSAEAIEESLMKLNTEKIKVNIISNSLGNITESDVKRAEDSQAHILGFHIKTTPVIENLIREKKVKVKLFSIIYDLIKYVKEEMTKLIEPEIVRKNLGRLKVLAIFRTEGNNQILGGKVLDGLIENDSLIEVIRDKNIVTRGKLIKLQSGKQDVSFVESGECGIKYEGKPLIIEGDILEIFKEEKIITTI